MVKVTSLLIKAENELGFSFGVRASTDMEIQCIKVTMNNLSYLRIQ